MVINKTNIHQLYAFLIFHKEKFIAFHKNSPEILEYLHKSVLEKKTISFNNEMENIISDFFVKNNFIFDEKTPIFFTLNRDCVINSIRKDVLTFKYTNKINEEEIREIICEEAIKQQYVLRSDSPIFLKSNYDVILGSISLEPYSINFSSGTYSLSKEQQQSIVDAIINTDYIISSATPHFLKRNLEVVLSSMKKDIGSVQYSLIQDDPKIIKFLVDSNSRVTSQQFRQAKISCLLEDNVLEAYFDSFDLFSEHSKQAKQKNIEFIKMLLSTSNLDIKTVNEVLNSIIEETWNNYKDNHPALFTNVLGKLLAILRNEEKETSEIEYLLNNMKKVLGPRFTELDEAVNNYCEIYNNINEAEIEKLQQYQDNIAQLCKLYLAAAKEDCKKERTLFYTRKLKEYFKVNINHPDIYEKALYKLKKEKFYDLLDNDYVVVENLVENIINKYINFYSREEIFFMIYTSQKDSNEYKAKYRPLGYEEYCRLEKVQKLVNRLNKGYITIDSPEVYNYKHFIELDESKYKVINDINFNKKELQKIKEYRQRLAIFNKVTKETSRLIKSITIEEETLSENINSIIDTSKLPFTDEYFIFDSEKLLNEYSCSLLSDFFEGMDEQDVNLLDPEQYNNFSNIFLNNGFFWFLIIWSNISNYWEAKNNFIYKFITIAQEFSSIKAMAQNINIDISKFNEIINAYRLNKVATPKQIAILNKEVMFKIYKDISINDKKKQKKILNNAITLACNMVVRNKSTVPYIKGEYSNYKYSMYDALDTEVFLSGINTGACFRIGGIDNDFLHYCCLDKNGFVIKITDADDEFLARASGFRAGNYVFINQLRFINSIYNYDSCESDEIVNVFYKACNDIIEISQNNDLEKEKIEYVFATCSYGLDNVKGNSCGYSVQKFLRCVPINKRSIDWFKFVHDNDLQESSLFRSFNTDFNNYPLLCIASSKDIKKFERNDINKKDVPAVYNRVRNTVIISTEPTEIDLLKINKTKAIHAHMKNERFEGISVPIGAKVYIGDNWYIIAKDNQIIEKCVLEHDKNALKEYKEYLVQLDCFKEKSNILRTTKKVDENSNERRNNIKVKRI